MEVSVVVPTYRRPELLRRCLTALKQQSLSSTAYELVVVSDGPDETTEAMVKACQDGTAQLRYLQLPQKKGPAAARNYGWLHARAQLIAFTDDDCLPDPEWLTELQKHADLSSAQAITGRVIVPRGKRPTDYEQNTAGLETADFITANCACTKAALVKTGGFDEQFSMAWREDSDLEFKLMEQNIGIKKVESAVVIHPVRSAPFGVSIKEQKKTLFNALLYKKYPQLYRKKIQSTGPWLYYCIIAAFVVMLCGIVSHTNAIFLGGLFIWAALTCYFIYKRLRTTSLTANHILEMVVTSLVIPFVSVYWQWYGAVKYKVLFI